MASRKRNLRPSTNMTRNGKTLEQQSIKLIQMKTIAGASVDVPSEVIELKEQKAIQPPSIAVNESRYLYSYLYQVCATVLEIEK